MFYVQRTYGNNKDFLKSFDPEYGTVCTGTKKNSMAFSSESKAVQAMVRASLTCNRGGGSVRPMDMTFNVV